MNSEENGILGACLSGVGGALACLLLLQALGCKPPGEHEHGHDDHGHAHHGHGDHGDHDDHEDVPKGPHGGRLLTDGDFALEVAIHEKGIPPEFRVYASQSGSFVAPKDVELKIELRRLGGRVDQHTFHVNDSFLKGEQVVYEPHSFDAIVTAVHAGRTHRWEYSSSEAHTTIGAEAQRKAGIRLETVGGARIRSELRLPGEVRFNEERSAGVRARFDGVVVEVRKHVGETAKAGETLAVIESRSLADARADYIDAVHRLELAQAVFVREQGLREKKIGVEQDYLKARHEMEEMEIRKQTARQKLLTLGISTNELGRLAVEPDGEVVTFQVRRPFREGELSRFNLSAPLDGAVVARKVAAGQTVRADDVLFQVADLETVWVDLAVYPGQVDRVAVGQEVLISAEGRSVTGRLTYVSPFVVEPSRAITARVLVANRNGVWRPGQFVEGRVKTEEADVAVAVKAVALQTFRDWSVVFLNEGEQFEAAVVTVGRRDGDWVEITSGLKAGQRYVTEGSFVVKADILKSSATHDHDH